MFDVIVVGGNLAGASAAISAASRDLKVALIERNKKPFFPAHCGEAIDMQTLKWFNLYDLNYLKNPIKEIIINVEFKKIKLKYRDPSILVIDRNFIENELLKRAKNHGVKMILGNSMKDFKSPNKIVLADNKIIEGKIIIDGSGIACHVGKKIGLFTKLRQEDIGVLVQSRIESNFNKETMKFWFHKPYAPLGYAYLFPLNNKIANIGVGIMGGQKFDLNKALNEYIKNSISTKYKILSTFRSCVPLAPPLKKLYKDNVMITGDAARLVTSTTGSGIRNALISGKLSGIVAAKYINKEIESLEIYQKNLNKKLKNLDRIYNKKRKMENEKEFVETYTKNFSIINLLDRLIPYPIQKLFSKISQSDKLIFENLN